MTRATRSLALALIVVAANASCTTIGKPRRAQSPGEIAFQSSIRPLLEHRCVHCHNDKKPLAGLNFQDRDGAMDPAKEFIVPGQPENSRLYRAISREDAHPNVMPADGWGITSEQKAAFKTWINEGAPWPEGRAGRIRKKTYRVDTEDYL